MPPPDAIERKHMKSLNCGSAEVTEPLAAADDGACPSGNRIRIGAAVANQEVRFDGRSV